ncbi:MAG: hypothetical protein HKO14_04260 [Silicimonas sp.]|nr:hypothetical protein [Silicimonas sp.]
MKAHPPGSPAPGLAALLTDATLHRPAIFCEVPHAPCKIRLRDSPRRRNIHPAGSRLLHEDHDLRKTGNDDSPRANIVPTGSEARRTEQEKAHGRNQETRRETGRQTRRETRGEAGEEVRRLPSGPEPD